jgi:hypothetical protein
MYIEAAIGMSVALAGLWIEVSRGMNLSGFATGAEDFGMDFAALAISFAA